MKVAEDSFAVELKGKLPNHNVITVKELTDLAELCENHPKKDKFIEELLTYSKENSPEYQISIISAPECFFAFSFVGVVLRAMNANQFGPR